METFADIYGRAVEFKGGVENLEALLPTPAGDAELRSTGDDRYLAEMTRCIFRSGFVWKVVENKWPDFETAFRGFDPRLNAWLSDEDIEVLVTNPAIIRNLKKIESVRANAAYVLRVAERHGSFGAWLADWPANDPVGLMLELKKHGSRLGGHTGQYFLRFMGKDTFIFSPDVVRVLVRNGVVSRDPTSRRDMTAAQDFFLRLRQESGRPLCQISRILAASVG